MNIEEGNLPIAQERLRRLIQVRREAEGTGAVDEMGVAWSACLDVQLPRGIDEELTHLNERSSSLVDGEVSCTLVFSRVLFTSFSDCSMTLLISPIDPPD